MDDLQVVERLILQLEDQRPPTGMDATASHFANVARAVHRQRTRRLAAGVVGSLATIAVLASAALLLSDSVRYTDMDDPAMTGVGPTHLAPLRQATSSPPPPAWVLAPFAELSRGVEANSDVLTGARYDVASDSITVLTTDGAVGQALVDTVAPHHPMPHAPRVEVVQYSRSDLLSMMNEVIEAGSVAGQRVTGGWIAAGDVMFGISLEEATDEARMELARRYGETVQVSEGAPILQSGP